jgi:hypothetical protein
MLTFLILCLSYSPQAFTISSKLYYKGTIIDFFTDERSIFYQLEYTPVLANFYEEQPYFYALNHKRMNRYLWNSLHATDDNFPYYLPPLFISSLFAYILLFVFGKLIQHRSILAFSKGGHAPPVLCSV